MSLPYTYFKKCFFHKLGPNQVSTFLSEHGGPGVQHIGLHTNDIINCIQTLKEREVKFITPPSAYYSEVKMTFIYIYIYA